MFKDPLRALFGCSGFHNRLWKLGLVIQGMQEVISFRAVLLAHKLGDSNKAAS